MNYINSCDFQQIIDVYLQSDLYFHVNGKVLAHCANVVFGVDTYLFPDMHVKVSKLDASVIGQSRSVTHMDDVKKLKSDIDVIWGIQTDDSKLMAAWKSFDPYYSIKNNYVYLPLADGRLYQSKTSVIRSIVDI